MEENKNETVEVADLETTQDPQGGLTALRTLDSSVLSSFSALRLRSAGAAGYDIWAPAIIANIR
jgi:hypothetical protein